MFEEADDELFSRTLANNNHVLWSTCPTVQTRSTAHEQERTIKL